MRRSKITTQQIIQDFQQIHGDTYDYSKVEYNTMHKKVIIICQEHGEFLQTPNAHIRQKQGCNKCCINNRTQNQKDTTESFINKSKQIHGNRYDYTLTEYGSNAHDKVKIICKEHGVFEMSPNSHLIGSNCPQCSKRTTGWTRTSWMKSCKGKTAKLYVIKCFNEDESFYKIGITNRKDLSKRFSCNTLMPYRYEIIKIIESKEDPIYIYNLERTLHKLHKAVRYTPKIRFAGDSECFSEIFINSKIH